MKMLKNILVGFFCLVTILTVNSQNGTEFIGQADVFFKTYVKEGKVDYKSIVKNPTPLHALLEFAKRVKVSEDNMAEYQSFWINGYNLLVIKSIVENYPIKSPLDKAGFFDLDKHDIGGIHITLNDIEHKMLRAKFPKEPRFHFVLVCAGLGCPPIINKAYFPKTLDAQMEEQTSIALNNPEFIQVSKNKVRISQIFEWYKDDFTQDGNNLTDFINQYRTEKLPDKVKISFYEYNWSLNEFK